MKIGIDASFLRKPGTGIGSVTEQTLRVLASLPEAAGHRFVLYLESDVDISFLPSNFEKHVFLPRWTRDDVPRRCLWERKLSKEAVTDGCEVFVSLSQSSAVFAKDTGIRHTMVVHDIIPLLFPAYRGALMSRLHSDRVLRGIGSADRIIAVSNTTKRDLELNLGIPAQRIDVAYPDCDARFRATVPAVERSRVLSKYALRSGYIYHGGGLEIRKNAQRLLEAYAALRKSRGDVPPLVISGRVHSRRNRLATDVRGIIRRLKLTDSVRLLGFVPDEDMPALYKEALFFVYPSLYEGFGIPVLEAFAVGTPAVAGRTAGAVPEVAGHAAWLVETQETDALREGLDRMLSDASLRETLVGRGSERAKDFSWSHLTRSVFRDIVEPETSEVSESDADKKQP